MMKKRLVTVEVMADDRVSVEALRIDLTKRIRKDGDRDLTYKKATLPDPDTIRRGMIYYSQANVLQKNYGTKKPKKEKP